MTFKYSSHPSRIDIICMMMHVLFHRKQNKMGKSPDNFGEVCQNYYET